MQKYDEEYIVKNQAAIKCYTKVQLQLINVLQINDRKTIWANLVAILIALLPTSFSLKCLGYSL